MIETDLSKDSGHCGPSRHLGIDTGGTFTDFLHVDGDRVSVTKLPSTPDDPGRVILEYLESRGGDVRDGLRIVHGTTVATNTLLERRGAKCALIVTRGFADVIEIGRQDRPRIYDLSWRPPEPLIPRERRFEVDERMGPGGEIVQPLDRASVQAAVDAMVGAGAEAVAVCLLFSPEAAEHEQSIRAALLAADYPGSIVLSSEVHPELREYERFSTTTICAYVTPAMERYLSRLSAGVAPARFFVMESAGGIVDLETLRGEAVRTVLSGPAGGVVAASHIAGEGSDLLTFDMGGTSTDVAVVSSGALPKTRRFTIGELPVAIPVVDVHTVGAGGGSEAWIDAGGALRVGPRSAGAHPGPVCYQRGGRVATVTDAHVYLGRLPGDTALGGGLHLDPGPIEDALLSLAEPLGISPREVATGIVRVVEAEMERALRRITQERGIDPRTLTLLSFGGAGGLHAVSLARALQLGRVTVPPHAGVLSAAGMLLAPQVETVTRAVWARLEPALLAGLATELGREEERLRDRRVAHGDDPARIAIERELSMRYVGQGHEIDVPWHGGDPREEFLAHYHARYGSVDPDRPIEVITARSVVAVTPQWGWDTIVSSAPRSAEESAPRRARVWLDDDWGEVPRHARASLVVDEHLPGPRLIEEVSSTTWVPAGCTVWRDQRDALQIDVGMPRDRSST